MAWKISYTIKDEKDARSIMGVHVTAVNIVGILDSAGSPLEYAADLALLIEPLISGQIVAININVSVPLPAGLKTAPELTSDVEEGATFTFITADKFTAQVRIPTFRETLQSGESVTLTNPDVSEFVVMVALPEELPANWSVGATDARGGDIVGVTRARADFKRSRR